MQITSEQLAAAVKCPHQRADVWVAAINAAMAAYAINTTKRIAAFLAQIGHESGSLVYAREIWGPTPAQVRYEGRKDLGNVVTGDGKRYKGRGLIQITGRANYRACGEALGTDLENNPLLLEDTGLAAKSAAWFWETHGCNELADEDKFEAITRRINGGLNGQKERLSLWEAAKQALGEA